MDSAEVFIKKSKQNKNQQLAKIHDIVTNDVKIPRLSDNFDYNYLYMLIKL